MGSLPLWRTLLLNLFVLRPSSWRHKGGHDHPQDACMPEHLYEVCFNTVRSQYHHLGSCSIYFNTGPLQTVKAHTTSWDITVMLLVFLPTKEAEYCRQPVPHWTVWQDVKVLYSSKHFFSAICWCLQPAIEQSCSYQKHQKSYCQNVTLWATGDSEWTDVDWERWRNDSKLRKLLLFVLFQTFSLELNMAASDGRWCSCVCSLYSPECLFASSTTCTTDLTENIWQYQVCKICLTHLMLHHRWTETKAVYFVSHPEDRSYVSC